MIIKNKHICIHINSIRFNYFFFSLMLSIGIEPSPSRRILLMHTYGSKLRSFLESLKRRSEPELRPGLGC